ncbi:SMI1/KNR4 family protein [Deinococcus aquaedulcis]|uniref:SMI1/KNR4 family protein n=1 Tax=Deinococcus aquaedulcis TaxID=2840455 RepID=UPI001C8301D6|nr:SMI1/KNR4 family protein [Deinococcus aquaedulcis]
MWRHFLQELGLHLADCAPASPAAIEHLEHAFELVLPEDLKSLLLEVGALSGSYGEGMLWSPHEMEEQNRVMRQRPQFGSLYMPFEGLFFIGDLGNGDLIGLRVLQGEVEANNVFRWDHESDSRWNIQLDLKGYLQAAATGNILGRP